MPWLPLLFWALVVVCVVLPVIRKLRLSQAITQLRGKRVVICGASTGIGRELALHYGRCGARVVIVARSKETLEKVAEDSRAAGAEAVFVCPGDLSTAESCAAVIAAAKQHLGGIDTLVLNHIRPYFGEFLSTPLSEITSILSVNLLSYMYLTHAAAAELRLSRGNIVFVSSVAGKIGVPKVAPYSAAKHALHGFFDSMRLELELLWGADHGVGITGCVLGNIDTESAKEVTKGHLRSLPRASPSSTARAIVEAGALRVREVYYPLLETLPGVIMHRFLPRLTDRLVLLTVGKMQQ